MAAIDLDALLADPPPGHVSAAAATPLAAAAAVGPASAYKLST
jgi:hypothetical protein